MRCVFLWFILGPTQCWNITQHTFKVLHFSIAFYFYSTTYQREMLYFLLTKCNNISVTEAICLQYQFFYF